MFNGRNTEATSSGPANVFHTSHTLHTYFTHTSHTLHTHFTHTSHIRHTYFTHTSHILHTPPHTSHWCSVVGTTRPSDCTSVLASDVWRDIFEFFGAQAVSPALSPPPPLSPSLSLSISLSPSPFPSLPLSLALSPSPLTSEIVSGPRPSAFFSFPSPDDPRVCGLCTWSRDQMSVWCSVRWRWCAVPSSGWRMERSFGVAFPTCGW